MVKTATNEKKHNTTTANDLIFVRKIKIKNDNTSEISFTKSNDLASQIITFTGKEEVTEDFKTTFQKTVDGFIGVIPRLAADKNKITMNIIRLDYDQSGFLKNALYSVKYAFNDQNNAVINISTPPLPIYKEGMENTFTIAGIHEDALHDVIAKAKVYINGDTRTKQMKLVVDNSNE